jgi:hypothetical protein
MNLHPFSSLVQPGETPILLVHQPLGHLPHHPEPHRSDSGLRYSGNSRTSSAPSEFNHCVRLRRSSRSKESQRQAQADREQEMAVGASSGAGEALLLFTYPLTGLFKCGHPSGNDLVRCSSVRPEIVTHSAKELQLCKMPPCLWKMKKTPPTGVTPKASRPICSRPRAAAFRLTASQPMSAPGRDFLPGRPLQVLTCHAPGRAVYVFRSLHT